MTNDLQPVIYKYPSSIHLRCLLKQMNAAVHCIYQTLSADNCRLLVSTIWKTSFTPLLFPFSNLSMFFNIPPESFFLIRHECDFISPIARNEFLCHSSSLLSEFVVFLKGHKRFTACKLIDQKFGKAVYMIVLVSLSSPGETLLLKSIISKQEQNHQSALHCIF